MTEEFKVEKNIKRPARNSGRKPKYPFRKMKVGDSFFILVADRACRSNIAGAARNSANMARIRDKTVGRFSSRQVEGGVRVWRIE